MLSVHVRRGPLDDADRGALVFAGDLVVFTDVDALGELCALTTGMIAEICGDADVDAIRRDLGDEQARARLEQVRRWYRRDEQVSRLWAAALTQVGVDVSVTGWDWRHLRVLPPAAAAQGPLAPLGHHRDTWSSNVPAQTNWWTPKVALTRDRALAFLPRYWSQPLANTSADWDLEAIRRAGRSERSRASAPAVAVTPIVPTPTEPVDTSDEVRIVVQPGDLLCFSGAHVHASVPNVTDRSRVSAELRTVALTDVRAGRGAPNVDGAAPHVAMDWFRLIGQRARLSDLLDADPRVDARVGGA